MPHYLIQVGYTPEAWATLIKNPVSRLDQIRPAFERLGGKIHAGFGAFGDYDTILLAEMPSNADVAALALAAAAGGSVRTIKTTPLLTNEEMLEALKKASKTGYRAVGAGQ